MKHNYKTTQISKYSGSSFDLLTIRDEFLFGAVMQDEKICMRLLEEILEMPIDHIEYLEHEKNVETGFLSRGIRLDIYVKDESGTVLNVEMQARRQLKNGVSELPRRTRYYTSTLDVDQLGKGEPYQILPDTYVIFICTFDEFHAGRYRYTFTARCKEDPSLELDDGLTRIILNSKGNLDGASSELKSFLRYINGDVDENSDLVKTIESRVQKIKADSKWRRAYMRYELEIQDARQEGREEGIHGAIEIMREVGCNDETILAKLIEKFNLSEKEAYSYLLQKSS